MYGKRAVCTAPLARTLGRAGITLALLSALSGCTTVPAEGDPLLIKISEIERRLGTVEEKLRNDSLLEIVNEVQAMREDMRGLRGSVENVQNDMDGVRDRQRELFLQIDDRLAKVEARPVAATPMPSMDGVSDGAVAALGAGMSDSELYNAAFELLKARRYDEARAGFLQVLSSWPQSSLLAQSRYWAAECYYVTSNFEAALPEFVQVVSEHPASNKVPDALLKIGYSQYELGSFGEARQALEQVSEQYPNTTAARLAEERLTRMRNEGR